MGRGAPREGTGTAQNSGGGCHCAMLGVKRNCWSSYDDLIEAPICREFDRRTDRAQRDAEE